MTALRQAGRDEGSFQAGALLAGHGVDEVDAPPQRLAGALRGDPGRIGRLRVPLGDQVGALGLQH